MITIRRIRIGESDLFKQLRLTSLQDAPYAFPATYEAALQRSAESWREQAERTARGTDRATFIAFSEDMPVGMAAIYRREDQLDAGELLQVWVSPEYRGTSVVWDLMEVIFKWAGENYFHRIIAGVTKVNARALKFYTNYGFSMMEETSTGVYLVKEVQKTMTPAVARHRQLHRKIGDIMNDSFTFASVPESLTWKNQPAQSTSDARGQLGITTGPQTDWFRDPAGEHVKENAPIALFVPPDPVFRLQAKVTVEFAATYDAGTLFVFIHDALWAKLCFEYSPQQQPMIVSVVTRGVSDDCNSVSVGDRSVYLRIYRQSDVLAFHYSLDGQYWHFVRHFSLGSLEQARVGFSTQSPTGQGCRAVFSEIRYTPGDLSDLRNGE